MSLYFTDSSDHEGNDDDFVPPNAKKSKHLEPEEEVEMSQVGDGHDDKEASDEEYDPYIKKILDRQESYRRAEALKRAMKVVPTVVSVPSSESVSCLPEKTASLVEKGTTFSVYCFPY